MGGVEVYQYHTPFFANYILRLTPHLSVNPLLCANHVQYPLHPHDAGALVVPLLPNLAH